MPSTISRTYGKKPAQPKRKTSPGSNENGHNGDPKRRKLTPSERGASTDVGARIKMRSPSPRSKPTKLVASTPAPPTPTKLTKRMLGRSRTESAIDSQPATAAMAARTISLPTIPSSSSQPTPSEDQEQPLERRPALTTSVSAPRVKRTYAGQSRSFLIPLSAGDFNLDVTQGTNGQEDEFLEHESYSSLRLRWGVDNPEDDPALPSLSPPRSKSNSNNGTPSRKGKGKAPAVYLPPNMMNPLKSITELRSKGESRRFLDEVGYLFEGMDPSNSTGLKSASEITTKLCDEEFARKAKAADFYHKTWDIFLKTGAGRDEDKILDILLVFLVALVARNLDTLVELARQEITAEVEGSSKPNGKGKAKDDNPDTLVGILFFILRTSADVDPLAMASPSHPSTDFEFKQEGLSKKDRIMLSNLYTTISSKSQLFPPDTPISTALLTTHILRNLPSSLLPLEHIPDLLYSLRSSLSAFSPDNPSRGKHPDEDDESEPQYECIRNYLHLLDMCLLGQWQHSSNDEDSEDNARQQILNEIKAAKDNWFADGLIVVAIHAEKKLREDRDVDAVSECLEVLLRVLVTLTNDDESWARKVTSNDFAVMSIIRLLLASVADGDSADVKAKKHSASGRIQDRLCLCLGLLTNLVQSVPEFKDTLRRTKASPTCITCTEGCTCPDSLNGLQILVRIYDNHTPPSHPTTGTHHTSKIEPNIKQEPEVTASPSPTSHLEALSIAEAAEASLIQGTLAILFGLLMDDSLGNQEVILSSMTLGGRLDSGGSGGGERLKLTELVEQAREFVVVYKAMNSKSAGGGEGEGEDRSASASEVLRVLERLRDES